MWRRPKLPVRRLNPRGPTAQGLHLGLWRGLYREAPLQGQERMELHRKPVQNRRDRLARARRWRRTVRWMRAAALVMSWSNLSTEASCLHLARKRRTTRCMQRTAGMSYPLLCSWLLSGPTSEVARMLPLSTLMSWSDMSLNGPLGDPARQKIGRLRWPFSLAHLQAS